MEEYRIAIVEDTSLDMERCLFLLHKFEEKKGFHFDINTFTAGGDFLHKFDASYDFIILDINLKESNGIEIARRIREKDESVVIMFTTNLAKYATFGYEVNAIDFVLKPLNEDSFLMKLNRAFKYIVDKNNSSYTLVQSDEGIIKVSVNSIIYVEVLSHDILFHLKGGETIQTHGTLKNYEESLKKYNFFRCNNCYLVNGEMIEKILKYTVYLTGGVELEISHPKKKKFLEDFREFIMKKGM